MQDPALDLAQAGQGVIVGQPLNPSADLGDPLFRRRPAERPTARRSRSAAGFRFAQLIFEEPVPNRFVDKIPSIGGQHDHDLAGERSATLGIRASTSHQHRFDIVETSMTRRLGSENPVRAWAQISWMRRSFAVLDPRDLATVDGRQLGNLIRPGGAGNAGLSA